MYEWEILKGMIHDNRAIVVKRKVKSIKKA